MRDWSFSADIDEIDSNPQEMSFGGEKKASVLVK